MTTPGLEGEEEGRAGSWMCPKDVKGSLYGCGFETKRSQGFLWSKWRTGAAVNWLTEMEGFLQRRERSGGH